MSRGTLDDSTAAAITARLPDLRNLQDLVLCLWPDLISTQFNYASTVPIAAVCLQDAIKVLAQVWYALYEAFAHQAWYREKGPEPNERTAVFFARFYVDDAALRLYAAAEHSANGIIAMLELTDEKLSPYRGSRVSQASVLGHFLRQEVPNHPIAKAIYELASSDEWKKVMDYRNRWVHEQPPSIDGLGVVWTRYKRWKPVEGARTPQHSLGIGIGDEPEYTVDELLNLIQPALFGFTKLMSVVVEFYIRLIGERGLTFDPVRHEMQVKII